MKKSSGIRGEKILTIFYIMLIITRIWFCLVDFAKQGAVSGILSAIMGVIQIYMAYLLKNRHEWPLWIFRVLALLHLFFLLTRIIMRPIYIYLIVFDIFYLVSVIVMNIFISDIKSYLDGSE